MDGTGTPVPQENSLAALSLVDASDWKKTTETILQCCVREFSAESASIFLTENGGDSLRLVRAIGSRKNRHCGKSFTSGEGISGFVASTKDPLLVTDFSDEKRLNPRKQGYPVDTLMSCPVLKDPFVLAVINVAGRRTGRPFSKDDLRKLQNISDRCTNILSQTIESWRSFQEDNDAARRARDIQMDLDKSADRIEKWGNHNESILRSLSEQVLIFDSQFNITYCSKDEDFAELFGREKDVRNILDLPLNIERNELTGKLNGVIREGTPFTLTNVQIKDSPKFRVANLSFSPFSSTSGNPLGGLLLVDDNTANYEIQQRLVEAEKFSLIGSLTSMITHEVNNPLDGVMRLINLSLAQLKEEEPIREYLSEAQKGLNRIASLVNSLLNFSRKSMSLDSEFATLNAVTENAMAIIRNRHHEKDISIDLSLAPENPTVRTNDFYQIISNLVSNSYDAVPSGSGSLKVTTEVDGGLLHLMVTDNGSGIPRHLQSRIFNTFYTTKDYGKGTGLGLAIVKKMVEKYGGTIEADPGENMGTKMHLTFPLDRLTP